MASVRRTTSRGVVLKEQFVGYVELLLRGVDPSSGRPADDDFWSDFFLLRPNVAFLSEALAGYDVAALRALARPLRSLVLAAARVLSDGHAKRTANVADVLCALLHGGRPATDVDPGRAIIESVAAADAEMATRAQRSATSLPVPSSLAADGAAVDVDGRLIATDSLGALIAAALDLLQRSAPGAGAAAAAAAGSAADAAVTGVAGTPPHSATPSVDSSDAVDPRHAHALRLLTASATAIDAPQENLCLAHLLQLPAFDALLDVTVGNLPDDVVMSAVFLLASLMSLRTSDAINPYRKAAAMVADEQRLGAIGNTLTRIYTKCNRLLARGADAEGDVQKGGIIGSLTSAFGLLLTSPGEQRRPPPAGSVLAVSGALLLFTYELLYANRNFGSILVHSHSSASPHSRDDQAPASLEPSNLLAQLVTYSSFVFQLLSDETSEQYCRLVLSCLALATEDAHANAFMHDPNMAMKVLVHWPSRRRRRPARADGIGADGVIAAGARPIACAMIDALVDFIQGNLKKKLRYDLYERCLGVIHRLLCYQKRQRVRLTYPWQELWTAIIALCRHVWVNLATMETTFDAYSLCERAVNIFNIFITFGDTLLPNPESYDMLYYEVIRVSEIFQRLHAAAQSRAAGGRWRLSAKRLSNALVNIIAIVRHFEPKIAAWTEAHGSPLEPSEVLNVVKTNYDTLTLKLHESLDNYESYSEKAEDDIFFHYVSRSVVRDFRVALPVMS